MIAFFDASALIYLLEGHEALAGRVRGQLAGMAGEHPDLGAAVSCLSWLECRVGSMRDNDSESLGAYDVFFARPDLIWVELPRDVVDLTAAIRVRHGLRTPGALGGGS